MIIDLLDVCCQSSSRYCQCCCFCYVNFILFIKVFSFVCFVYFFFSFYVLFIFCYDGMAIHRKFILTNGRERSLYRLWNVLLFFLFPFLLLHALACLLFLFPSTPFFPRSYNQIISQELTISE